MNGPAEERNGRPWQDVFDFVLLTAALLAFAARAYELLTTKQFLVVLALAFGAACAAYLVSVLREDEARPMLLPLIVLGVLVLVDEVALSGVGPRWLEIVVVFGILLWFVIDRGPSDEGAPRNVDDRPHPYP